MTDLDTFRAETRAWWGQQYQALLDGGITGFWNDMNEPSILDPAFTRQEPPSTTLLQFFKYIKRQRSINYGRYGNGESIACKQPDND